MNQIKKKQLKFLISNILNLNSFKLKQFQKNRLVIFFKVYYFFLKCPQVMCFDNKTKKWHQISVSKSHINKFRMLTTKTVIW